MRIHHFVLPFVVTVAVTVACSGERAPPPAPPGGAPPVAPGAVAPLAPMDGPGGPGGPAAPATGAPPPAAVSGASITWATPEGWVEQPGSSRMRATQFEVGTAPDGSPVQCVVFIGITGGTQANIDRWIGQFRQPDGGSSEDVAEVTESEHDGLRITRASVTGTFAAQAMPGQGEALNAEEWRLLGAVVENGDDSIFIKMVGPAQVLDANEAQFDALLASLRPR